MQKTVIAAIIVINFIFICYFMRDLMRHKSDFMKEPASSVWTPISQIVIFFFSTFGISDFAISTAIYQKAKWVSMKKLPGTLNAQDVIPIFVMSLAYITSINVGTKTLLVCIICQVLGAYIGPRFVVRLPENSIRSLVIVGLLVATALIIAGKLGLITASGTATELFGWKLVVTGFLLFIYGALNNIGIGSFSLTMATVYAMGMDPIAAFPIMMGGCAFSLPIGSMQFIKLNQYSRKITLFSVFGIIGVLVAVLLVKNINTSVIQWIVIVVLLYSAYSLYLGNREAKLIKDKN